MKLLAAKVDQAGSQVNFARSANISQQYLGDVLKQRRAPGPKVLHALGFREVRLYEKEEDK